MSSLNSIHLEASRVLGLSSDGGSGGVGLVSALGLLALAVAGYLVAQAVYRLWFHPLAKFPGPTHMSLTSLHALYSTHVGGNWIRHVARLHRRYGPVVRIGPNHISLEGSIGWPDVYAHRPSGKGEYQKMPPLFKESGDALIAAPRDVHRRQRRQMAHAFSDAALLQQESVMARYVDLLLDRLAARARDGEAVDIVAWLNFTTFDIIGDLAFSDSFQCLENNGYHPWVRSVFTGLRGFNLLRFKQSYPLLGSLICLAKPSLVKSSTQIRHGAKDKARVRIARGPDEVDGHHDFMHYMMKKNRDGAPGMTEGELLANAPVLVIAGSETTATALSGLFFYLSRNRKAYEVLVDEIRTAFDSEDSVDLRASASLEYLQACLNEILRVYPPAAETGSRISPGDMIAGEFVPAGTRITVYQWATFHSPDNFAEPDSYIPERWLPTTHARYDARFAQDKRSVFKPFSFGPRDCIGKNLAFSEMRLIVCRLLLRFDIDLAFAQDGWHDNQKSYLLWEKAPLYVKLHPRDSKA